MWENRSVDDFRQETALFYHYLLAAVYGFVHEDVDSHVGFY